MSISCTDPLPTLANEPCGQAGYGRQIVGLFIQKMEGSPFDGAAIAGTEGGIITQEADWQAKLDAVNDDKVIFLSNLAGAEVAEAATDELSGNELPYGGVATVDMNRSLTGRIQYPTASTIAAVNDLNTADRMRVWLLDENDFLQGGDTGIEMARLNIMNLVRGGLGQATPAHFPFSLTWRSMDEAAISAAPIAFLKSLKHA